MDTSDSKTKEILGRKFKIVKNGLDDAEVLSFVTGLVEQNKELTTKLEHIDTLKKLAEKTVIEAEKQAKDIRTEIEEKASARAEAILAEAEEKAQAEASRIVSEADQKAERIVHEKVDQAKKQGEGILNAAEERAERIRADANKEAEEVIARAKQEANATEQQTREIIKSAEEKAQAITANANEEAGTIIATARQQAAELEEKAQAMVTSAETKAEEILNEARGKAEEIIRAKTEAASKEAQAILKDARRKATEEIALMKQEAEQLLARSKKVTQTEIKDKLKKVYQELLSDLGAIKETEVVPSLAEDKTSEQPEPDATTPVIVEAQVVEAKEPIHPPSKAEKEAAPLYQGPVELVIPPPLGLDRMLQLHKHLRNIPDVEVLNLGVAADKSITIRLVVGNPIPLHSILEDLPEVEQATEAPQEAEATTPSRKGGEKEKAVIKRIIVTTRK